MSTRKTGLQKVSTALQHSKKPDIYIISGHGNFQKEKIRLGPGQYVVHLASTGCSIGAQDTPSYSKSFRDWIRNDIDMRRYLRGEPSKSKVPVAFSRMSGIDVHGPGEIIADIGVSLYTTGPKASPRDKLPIDLMYSPTYDSPHPNASGGVRLSPYTSRKWCGMFKTGDGKILPSILIPYTKSFDNDSIKELLKGRKGIFIISACRSPRTGHYAPSFIKNVKNIAPNKKEAAKLASNLENKILGIITYKTRPLPEKLRKKYVTLPLNEKQRHVFTTAQIAQLVNANLAKYYKTRVKTILGRVPKTNANYTRAVKRARGSPVSASPNKKAPKKNSGNGPNK